MASASSSIENVNVQIRKYRKKLCQIEHLISVRRTLTEEEKQKVCLKSTLRKELQDLLTQVTDASKRISQATAPSSENITQNFSDEAMKRPSTSRAEVPSNQSEEEQNIKNEGKRFKQEDRVHTCTANDHPETSRIPSSEVQHNGESAVPSTDFKRLARSRVVCRHIEGHSDIIWSVAADKDILISGSRDTTAKVWDVATGEEVCSLRGHTDSVNAVCLPTIQQSGRFLTETEIETNTKRIALTASSDCHIKVWAVPTGEHLKSIYTFNNITCLGLMSEPFYAVLGTDGGKVEMWNVITGDAVQSVMAHKDTVTCLEVTDLQVCSGAQDGTVKIWLLRENVLQVIYTLDPGLDIPNPTKKLKQLKSVASQDGRLFLGDEGSNIKVLTWRRGRLSQIKNHCQKFGCTDALKIFETLLVSSSYDLDTGLGAVHFRNLPETEYLFSFPENTDRIRCLTVADSVNENFEYTLVTGGTQLIIWYIVDSSKRDTWKRYSTMEDCEVLDICYLSNMACEVVVSSSEDEITDDDDDEVSSLTDESIKTELSKSVVVAKPMWNWCSLL